MMRIENNKLEIALYFNINLNLLNKGKIMNFNFKSVLTVRIVLIVSSLTLVAVGAIFLYFFYLQPHPQIPPYRPELQVCKEDSDCAVAIRLDACCSCPKVFSKDQLKKDKNLVTYEEGKRYPLRRPLSCINVKCKLCRPILGTVCSNNLCQEPQQVTPIILQPDTMRPDVFNGHFEVLSEPVLGQVFEVDFTIKPDVDASRTTIQLFLPPAVELIRGHMEQLKDLRAGEMVQERFSLRATQPGEWEVRAYVSPEGISGLAWSYYLFVQSYSDHAGTSPQALEKETKLDQGWLDVLIDLAATKETSRNTWLVTLHAKPTADLSDCELAFILPEGSELSGGTQKWTGDLKPDRTQMIQASVTAPSHADAPVQGRCTCGDFIYRQYVYLEELD